MNVGRIEQPPHMPFVVRIDRQPTHSDTHAAIRAFLNGDLTADQLCVGADRHREAAGENGPVARRLDHDPKALAYVCGSQQFVNARAAIGDRELRNASVLHTKVA
jgi:hypothetical protein